MAATLAEEVAADLGEVLDKRRVEHCLLSMEGLAEGGGVLLGWGEVSGLGVPTEAPGAGDPPLVPLRDPWYHRHQEEGAPTGGAPSSGRLPPPPPWPGAQELVMLAPPRPRGPAADLPDLLDQCVTLGEEVLPSFLPAPRAGGGYLGALGAEGGGGGPGGPLPRPQGWGHRAHAGETRQPDTWPPAAPVASAGVCGPGGLRGEERGHRQKGGAAGGPGAPGHQDLVSW